MSDNSLATPELSMFGVKLLYLVGGFFGGVLTLSFLRNLTILQGVLAVAVGVCTAVGLGPLVVVSTELGIQYFLKWLLAVDAVILLPEGVAFGIAFILGLTGMNIIPGILKLSEMFRDDPTSIFRSRKQGD